MFLIVGTAFLVLLSIMLVMLWKHESLSLKRLIPRAKVEEYWSGEERRQEMRFKDDIELEYNIEKKSRFKNGKGIDISGGGMKLMLDEKLPNGAIMHLKFYAPGRKEAIEVEGEVVWTKETEAEDLSGKRFFRSGIKFIGVKEFSGTYLRQYVASLASKNNKGES